MSQVTNDQSSDPEIFDWPWTEALAFQRAYLAGVRDVVNHIVVFNATPAPGLGPPDERL